MTPAAAVEIPQPHTVAVPVALSVTVGTLPLVVIMVAARARAGIFSPRLVMGQIRILLTIWHSAAPISAVAAPVSAAAVAGAVGVEVAPAIVTTATRNSAVVARLLIQMKLQRVAEAVPPTSTPYFLLPMRMGTYQFPQAPSASLLLGA